MDGEAGVALRQVKLKVLYTFDTDHKNNHLARWPQTLEVQSAQLDDTNTIGCIDLRTCLQAVTTSSPELTSSVDNDYTIYAYDYSEPDTPLVGQGMLSRALAQEGNVDLDNEAMVTGRITKSVMGLFSKSAQETLEVKLRLTPMANPSFRRRSGSISSNPDMVQSQWNSLSQSNGVFRPASPMDTSGLEAMHRMLSEGVPARERMGSFHGEAMYCQNQNTSRPSSRAGTPSQAFNPPTRQNGNQSRPASRSGTRQPSHARRDSFNSGYYSAEEVIEEGPARKRAKVQKVEHPSRSNLNIERQADSLRVAASTASSVRLHRPTPLNPQAAALHNSHLMEDPVRPPTPIHAPTKTGRPRGRPRKVISANLLRGPKHRASSASTAPQQISESVFSSPEETRGDSVTSTPADLPSSPPVMPENQNIATSPQLPPLLNETDSGFMSGCLDELDFFADGTHLLDFNDFIHDKPLELQQAFEYPPVQDDAINVNHVIENPMVNLPPVFDDANDVEQSASTMEPPPLPLPPPPAKTHPVPALAKAHSFTTHHRSIVPAPRLAPALAPRISHSAIDRRSQSALPQVPASDPVGRSLQRSHTWAPEMSDAIMSDAVTNEEHSRVRPKKRVGKEQTKARLENAIASGEMPPFCDNCGTIETPAWRRAFTKIFETSWDEFETSLEPGECCYKEPVERDADGSISKFKGYKTERRADDKNNDDGWTQICLCNPCGLWFHKSKYPRPAEKWQKKDANEKRKRKRHSKAKKRPSAPKSAPKSDAPTPDSDGSSPSDTAVEGGDLDDNGDGDGMTVRDDDLNDDNEPELPPIHREYRGGSAEPANRGLKFSMNHHGGPPTRRVQSSPARIGNTRANAIEIDLTPKPTIRQLFPSPQSLKNKYNASMTSAASAEHEVPHFVRRSPRLNKVRDIFATPLESAMVVSVDGVEKENTIPTSLQDNSLEGFYDGGFDEAMPPPSTPKRRSERLLFKTPSKTPARDFGEAVSPNVQRTPSATRTPKVIHTITTKAIGDLQGRGNPAEMTPFTRVIHESIYGSELQQAEVPRTPRTNGSRYSQKTPKRVTLQDPNNLFDFPDLPSIQGSSPMGANLMRAFDFSEMTTDQLNPEFNDAFNTDITMPSSPPQGYFDLLSGKNTLDDNLWAELGMHHDTHSAYPELDDSETLHVGTYHGGLRKSPRKHAA